MAKKKKSKKSGKKKQAVKKKSVKKLKKRKSKIKRPGKAKKQKKEKVTVLGIVTHYFPKVNAAVIKLKKPLSVGDTVIIKGSTTQFEQKIESMQMDHVSIQKAKKGDEIGLEVNDRVREHDLLIAP